MGVWKVGEELPLLCLFHRPSPAEDNFLRSLARWGSRRIIGRWRFNLGEIALCKLLDGLHDVDECQPFLRQAILDAWGNLEEGLPLHKADLFQHLEPLRQRLGTDIAQGLLQFAKAFRAREKCVDDDERPRIPK